MLGYLIISMTCDYSWLPTFVGRLRWGLSFFRSPCHTLRVVGECAGAFNLSCTRSHERGGLSRAEGDCATLCSPNRLTEKEFDRHGATSVLRTSPHTLPHCIF
jgi:hypothetical protein